MRTRLLGVVTSCLLLAGTTPAHAAEAGADRAFRWQDPRIAESSGLVDLGEVVVTANDSGDVARLYVVDAATGATVRTVDYGVEVRDVEALAPAGPRHVWVGDIGDNRRERDDLRLHRVEVVPGPGPVVQSYGVSYAAGERADAESLVVLRSGCVAVITKSLAGGVVLRGPATLRADAVNVLRPVGQVRELATDAAYDATTGHVLVRGYTGLGAYDPATWERVATAPLPPQPQGETLSVGPGGRVLVGSEGAGTAVWRVPRPEAEPAEPIEPPPTTQASVDPAARSDVPVLLAAGMLVLGALGIGWALRRRDREDA